MKTVIITVAAFLSLCLLMTLNHGYIKTKAAELTSLAESLDFQDKEGCRTTITEIDRLWEKCSTVFSLTVSFREIDHLGECIISLSSAVEGTSENEFEGYRALLIDAIEGVARLESFSVMNIL